MDYNLLTSTDEILHCAFYLQQQKQIAVDLEFDKNRFRYGFNLCLLQIATSEKCFLIDPLIQEVDLKPVFKIFEEKEIQKIVYAFGEDLRLLHSLHCFPKNVYDLSIASRLLDYPAYSLANFQNLLLGIDTSKDSQKSNWFKRPLTEKQLQYAATDVLYLEKLHQIISALSKEKGVSEWIDEENNFAVNQNYLGIDDKSYIKEKDKRDLSQYQWCIYTQLLDYRETLAMKLNRPSFQVVDNEVFRKIVLTPDLIHQWTTLSGIFPSLRTEKTKYQVMEVIQQAHVKATDLNLSKTVKAVKRLSKNDRELIRKQSIKTELVKTEFFQPIQQSIAQVYGENTSKFIITNRLISDYLFGNREVVLNYKKELIEVFSSQLNLKWEGEE